MYVITGGAGFIGSNIAWGLNERGLGPLVIVDHFREADKWRNLANREISRFVDPENIMSFLDTYKRLVNWFARK